MKNFVPDKKHTSIRRTRFFATLSMTLRGGLLCSGIVLVFLKSNITGILS